MTASTHLSVGAAASVAIQKYLPNSTKSEKLFLGFMAGFASHLLLDSFPHQEYSVEGMRLASVLFLEIATTFFLFLFFRKPTMVNLIIFFGMAGGAMPDAVYFANKHLFDQARFGDLGSIIHLFSHDTVPLGFEVSMYIQFLLALMAFCFVKITPAK